MWWRASSSACSRSPRRSSSARQSGPRARSKGRSASLASRRSCSAAAAAAGRPERSASGGARPRAAAITWTGCSSASSKLVRSTSWRRSISSKARRSAASASGPRRLRKRGMLYQGMAGSSRSRNQRRCWAKESGKRRPSRGRAGMRSAAGGSGRPRPRRRSSSWRWAGESCAKRSARAAAGSSVPEVIGGHLGAAAEHPPRAPRAWWRARGRLWSSQVEELPRCQERGAAGSLALLLPEERRRLLRRQPLDLGHQLFQVGALRPARPVAAVRSGAAGGGERGTRAQELLALDQGGEAGDGGRLEEAGDRQLDREGVAQPRDDLGGQQRVAAELEEVVVRSHLLEAHHFLPEGGDGALDLAGGRDVGVAQGGTGLGGDRRPRLVEAGQGILAGALAGPRQQRREVAGGDQEARLAGTQQARESLDSLRGGHAVPQPLAMQLREVRRHLDLDRRADVLPGVPVDRQARRRPRPGGGEGVEAGAGGAEVDLAEAAEDRVGRRAEDHEVELDAGR